MRIQSLAILPLPVSRPSVWPIAFCSAQLQRIERFTVTRQLTSELDTVQIHPILSTPSMICLMELVCRRLVLPTLQPDQELIGHRIDVKHSSMVAINDVVEVESRLMRSKGPIRQFAVAAKRLSDNKVVGSGRIYMAVIPKTTLEPYLTPLPEPAGFVS